MTFTELLEEQRDDVRSQLRSADGTAEAQTAVQRILDQLLYRYVEDCESDYLKACASHLIESLKVSASLIDTAGKAEVWERELPAVSSGKEKNGKKRGVDGSLAYPVPAAEDGFAPAGQSRTAEEGAKGKVSPAGVLIFLAGLVLMAAGIVLTMIRVPQTAMDGIYEVPLGLVAGGGIVMFLAGLFFIRKKKESAPPETEKKVIYHTDPDKLYRSVQAMVVTLDRQIDIAGDEEKVMRKQLASADEGGLPKEELELYAGLLEAHASRDAEYALEKLSDVRYYLHQKDVDVVDYSADHESWFDLLPAEEAGTIRPALAKGGKLLVKGLAAEGR